MTPQFSQASSCAVLVAQYFLPLNVVASQRALRMARVLLERFDRVHVMCGDMTNLPGSLLDYEYGKEVVSNPRLIRREIRGMLTSYGYSTAAFSGQRLIGAPATRLLCGPGADWVFPLRRALAGMVHAEQVRLVLATGPPFITFGSVERFANQHGAPVILDYRDLWTSNPHAPYPTAARRIVGRWLERPVNRRATLITTVSDGCRTSLAASGPTAPIEVLYNTPDRAYLDFYREVVDQWQQRRVTASARARAKAHVVFTGQVYKNCPFAPFLKAVATMPATLVDQLEVHYYGDASLMVRAEFAQAGLTSILVDHGKVSKADSLRAILDGDLLLSLIHTDRISSDPAVTGHMSTKIYDYLLSGIPILNIGPVNAEINGLVARMAYSAFQSAPADDTAGIARVVEQTITRRVKRAEPLSVALPLFDDGFSRVVDEVLGKPR